MKRDGENRLHSVVLRLACAMITLLVVAVGLSGCGGLLDQAHDLEKAGDLKGAIAAYQKALSQDPDNIRILAPLGSDLMIQGKFDEALPIQEKTVKLDPKDAQTRVELAFNYLNHQNQLSDAVRMLKEAVALDGSAKNLTFLAQAQAADNDTVSAEASLRQAIAKDPKYPHAYTLLMDLLVRLGRTQDAAQVEDLARQQGVTLESSQ
jgi:Tfp pilus assembly protein PilF